LWDFLVTGVKIAFQHQAHDGRVACHALLDDRFPHFLLLFVLFVGIGMATVDHDDRFKAGLAQLIAGRVDALRVVIGAMMTAA
jgi:hypothetical protein